MQGQRVINDTLLISCPGEDGGLFLASTDKSIRLTCRPATGLFIKDEMALLAYQDKGGRSIRIYDGCSVAERHLAAGPMDLHDLLVANNRIYAAVTEENSVVSFDESYNMVDRWSLQGEKDSSHLNSIVFYQGSLLASVFGRFERHREYKEGTLGCGEVIDIISGETFIKGLSQPHSLTVVDDKLYVCSSEDRELRIYHGHALFKKISVPGYARGLAVGDKSIYIGLSMSRNSAACEKDVNGAAVAVISKADMLLKGVIHLACREIYDIRIINQNSWIVPHLVDESLYNKYFLLEKKLASYKSGYDAYKSGYDAYGAIKKSVVWKFADPVYKLEIELVNFLNFINNRIL